MDKVLIPLVRKCILSLCITKPEKIKEIFLRDYEENKKILNKLESAWIESSKPGIYFTIGEVILQRIIETDDEKLLGEISMIPYGNLLDRDNIWELTHVDPYEKESDIMTMYDFAKLQAYLSGEHRTEMYQTIQIRYGPMHNRINVIEKIYGFSPSFEEDPIVKKNVKRMKEKIIEFLNKYKIVKEEIKNDIDMASFICDVVIAPNINISHGTPYSISIRNRACHSELEHITNMLILNNIVIYSDEKKDYIREIIKDIDDLCRMQLLSLYEENHYRIVKFNKEGMGCNYNEVKKRLSENAEGLHPNAINKEVRNLDVEPLVISCIWMAALRILRKQIDSNTKTAILSEFGEEGSLTVLKQEKEKNVQQIREKDAEILKLRAQVNRLHKKLDEIKKPARCKEDKISSLQREYEREMSKMNRQIEQLNSKLDAERRSTEALEEKLEYIKSKSYEEKGTCIDFNKRYMFICACDSMKRKLKEWFPNSIISSSYNITSATAKHIEMVIVITTESRHDEFYRVKKKCITQGIKMVYCNNVNFDRICEAIKSA